MADRNQRPGLPQITLNQLAGPVDGALKGPPDHKPRANLAHVVVEDRLATVIAQLGGHLAQPQRLDARIGPQLPADPLPIRIELRHRRRPRIPRRRLGRQRPPNRLAVQPRPLADLTDRQPLDAVHAPDLRPLLHADHTLLLARSSRSSESPDPAGRTDPTPGGPLFDRRRWTTIHPAPTPFETSLSPTAGPEHLWSATVRRRYGTLGRTRAGPSCRWPGRRAHPGHRGSRDPRPPQI